VYTFNPTGLNPPKFPQYPLKDVEIEILPWFVTTLVDPSTFEPNNTVNAASLNSTAALISNMFGKNDSYIRWFANMTFQYWLEGVQAQMKMNPRPPYLCQAYPDYYSTVNLALDITKPVNLTCWTTAPAADKRSACTDAGSAWFKTNDGCYIPDYIVKTNVRVPERYPVTVSKNGKKIKKKFAELTDLLAWCPPPRHQVAAFKDQYSESTYCYGCTSLECKASMLGPANGSVELDCYTYGDNVRGDSLWWRWKNGRCYLPNQAFDAFSFSGRSFIDIYIVNAISVTWLKDNSGNAAECLSTPETPEPSSITQTPEPSSTSQSNLTLTSSK
jgi:hypothetical protein